MWHASNREEKHMYRRTTFAGPLGLLAAMLLAVGCSESSGPDPRASRLSPVALLVDRGLNLDFTGGQPTSGQLPTGYGCMDLPLGLNKSVAPKESDPFCVGVCSH